MLWGAAHRRRYRRSFNTTEAELQKPRCSTRYCASLGRISSLSGSRSSDISMGACGMKLSKSLTEQLNCRIQAQGGPRVYCKGCKYSLLITFSCKRRSVCSSCGIKRAVKFPECVCNEVIEDTSHGHTVFPIPKRLRVFFRYDCKRNSKLIRVAWGNTLSGVEARRAGISRNCLRRNCRRGSKLSSSLAWISC